jgi:hypothetical protein
MSVVCFHHVSNLTEWQACRLDGNSPNNINNGRIDPSLLQSQAWKRHCLHHPCPTEVLGAYCLPHLPHKLTFLRKEIMKAGATWPPNMATCRLREKGPIALLKEPQVKTRKHRCWSNQAQIHISIHFMYMSTFKHARRASTSSSIVAADVTAVARVLKSLTLAERKRNFRRYQKSKCQTVSNSVRQMLHLSASDPQWSWWIVLQTLQDMEDSASGVRGSGGWTSLFKTYPIYGRDR